MRDNWLSNRIFTGFDNIVDLCFDAWNRLTVSVRFNALAYLLDVMLCSEPLIEPEADAVDVPGQELCDAVDGMIGDALDHLPQIGLGIEAVRLGGFDQAVDRCRTQPTCIRTSECPIAPAEGNRAHGALCS